MRTILAVLAAVLIACATTRAQSEVYKPGNGVTLPAVVKEVKPQYTKAALDAKIHGVVVLEVVVLSSGEVGDVEVTDSLDTTYGLDQQAIDAARQWQFRPGMKDGKPVAVQIALEMTFTLK